MKPLNLLILFAKAPREGGVKTRMEPALGRREALELHRALLRDTIDLAGGIAGCDFELHTPDPEDPFWEAFRGRFPIRAQRGSDLGARMENAFRAGLATHERVVVIGSDAPTLPPEHLGGAFEALIEGEVVIGPGCDGGYYLIGARGSVPPVFAGIAWGGPTVLAETLSRLSPLTTRLLPFWYDLDTPLDLHLLRAHLPHLRSRRPGALRHTAAFLERLAGGSRTSLRDG